MSDVEFEEEEFSTQFNGHTLIRILAQIKPYWRWVAGFVLSVAIVSSLGSFQTFLSKQMVDDGIVPGNRDALIRIVVI